ncbi:MAG: zinc-dependent alcohol dehydrogenase family protein [Actinomycetota bacterium]|nr:zinc-dependent alcohol dehydrogenase family protein [Actinomycetota bacterium]
MRAAYFENFNEPIAVADVPEPTAPDGGVVVEVKANGVCRSDWHGWVGHDPSIPLPHVPGHEMSGVVAAIGRGVSNFSVGDRVTAPFVLGCGSCGQCASGNEQVCDNQVQAGFTGWGSLAEYVALPYADNNLVRLPESMSYETAAGLGCRFATAFRAVVDQGQVGSGSTVAVWGCGGVGLSAVMIAASLGAKVIAVDVNDEALALASTFGAAATVNARTTEAAYKTVRSLAGGGCDVSLDALGSTQTAIDSIRSLRTRGRHIQVGLMVGDDVAPPIPMWRLHALEIELYGSHGMQAHRYPDMLAMVADGVLEPDRLVTSHLTLTEGVERLMRMNEFQGTGFAVVNDFSR